MGRHYSAARVVRAGLIVVMLASMLATALTAPAGAAPTTGALAPAASPAASMPAAAVDRSVATVASGSGFSCALLNDGTVHCWGTNSYGQLGLGNTTGLGDQPGELPAAAVPLGGRAIAIAAGEFHTCAILADGSVHCWGNNAYGQLGVGSTDNRGDQPGELPTPAVPLGVGRRAVAISTAYGNSCAVLDDGTVHCWGANDLGQLGIGTTDFRGDQPGELPAPAVPLGPGRRAVSIGTAARHSCAVLDDGTVHCWGFNGEGQLGIGTTDNRGDQPGELPTPAVALGSGRVANALSVGSGISCVILDDGTVHCWGWNSDGELGIGAVGDRGDQPGELPTPAVALGTGRTAVAVSANWLHVCALLDDGTVHCWGYNPNGELGAGSTAVLGDQPGELPAPAVPLGAGHTATSIDAGVYFTCAVLDDGTVHCWGDNTYGELGIGTTDARGDAPGELPTPAVPLSPTVLLNRVSAGGASVCAIPDDGSVHCWGQNTYGQLGIGTTDARGDAAGEVPTPAVPLGFGRTATAISVGLYDACAVLDDGTVHCWGRNDYGQLGIGTTDHRGDAPGELPTPAVPLGRPAVAVATGAFHACALLDDGTVHCWGNNGSGQLGVGATDSRGDQPGELPTAAVPLGRPTVAVTTEFGDTCALLDDGTVHCWGYNLEGELGLGTTDTRGDAPGELPTAAVPLGRPAVAITAGAYHACAILDDASVHCWGYNLDGELGVGATDHRGDAAGELPTPAVPLGSGRAAVAIAAGSYHTCALLDDGTAHCWGYNGNGQLGVGAVDTRGDAPGELPTAAVPTGSRVAGLTLSDLSSCAVNDDGTVHCWGRNDFGQLGIGTIDSRGDAPGELPTAAIPTAGAILPAAITVDDASAKELDARTSKLTFHLTRTNVVGSASVDYTTADVTATDTGGDYDGITGTVTFPAGISRVALTVPVDPDLTNEATETLALTLSNAVGGHLADPYGVGTIIDNDPPPTVSIGDGNVVEGTGPNSTLKARVTLSQPSGQTVTIKYQTADGTATAPADYAKKSGNLTVAPGDTTAVVSIGVVADSTPEGTEYFFLALTSATNATLLDSVGTMYILDDDGARAGRPRLT